MAGEVSPEELRQAVQNQLVCKAMFWQAVPVHEVHNGETVWDGVVHVFYLDYHGDIDMAMPGPTSCRTVSGGFLLWNTPGR